MYAMSNVKYSVFSNSIISCSAFAALFHWCSWVEVCTQDLKEKRWETFISIPLLGLSIMLKPFQLSSTLVLESSKESIWHWELW